jgi:hypothetical protein
MIFPHYELSLLTKAIPYPNLTIASRHVGLSQPQLSRILQKLEHTLDVTLLNRSSKKRSTWTKAAYDLADFYSEKEKNLTRELNEVCQSSGIPKNIRMTTLEGLADIGVSCSNHLLSTEEIDVVEVDIHDLTELHDNLEASRYDLAIASTLPESKEMFHAYKIGWQKLQAYGKETNIAVLSSFEARLNNPTSQKKKIISNSLAVRKNWVDRYGGQTSAPTPVYTETQKPSDGLDVYIVINKATGPKFQKLITTWLDSLPKKI